jgi:hypothetical protein
MTLDDPVAEYLRAQARAAKKWQSFDRLRRRADGIHPLELGRPYHRETMKRLAAAEQEWLNARAEFLAARERLGAG